MYSNRRLKGFPLAVLFAAFISVWAAGPAIAQTTVEPVVLVSEAGAIKACGVRAVFKATGEEKRFELLVRREGNATILALRGPCNRLVNSPEGGFEIPTLDTANYGSTDVMQEKRFQSIEGLNELSAPATDDNIALLIQELMIGGGTFACRFEGKERAEQSYRLSGPLPNQVRAAYLNCSGDLFRPEEEEARRRAAQ